MTVPIRPEPAPGGALARLRAKREAAEQAAAVQQTTPLIQDPRAASALQGASFGWSDELLGAMRSPAMLASLATTALAPTTGLGMLKAASDDPAFQQAAGAERKVVDDYRQSDPMKAMGYEMLGGAAQGIGMGAAAAGEAGLSRLLNPATYKGIAALGAAEGAVAGAGNAQPGERGQGAAVGGAAGAVAAPIVTAGVRGAKRVGGMAVDALNLRAPAGRAAQAIEDGGSQALARLRAKAQAARDALPQLESRTGAAGVGVPQKGNFLAPSTRGKSSAGPLAGTKVVDEAGNPRTVYHGSPRGFKSFDPERGNGQLGPGQYWWESPGMAEAWATGKSTTFGDKGHAPNIRPARLAITDPLDATAPMDDATRSRLADAVKTSLPAETHADVDALAAQAQTPWDFSAKLWQYAPRGPEGIGHPLTSPGGIAKMAGYDGVSMQSGRDGRQWVTFNRSQIRSAFDDPSKARQVGAVNPHVASAVGGAGIGALTGAAVDDENRGRGAAVGAVAGAAGMNALTRGMAKRVAGRVADDAVPASAPAARGVRKVLQQLGVAPVEDRADELVIRAADDARYDLAAGAEKVSRGDGEMPEALMNLLGERGVQMSAALKTLPSGAKNTLKQRGSAIIGSTGSDVAGLLAKESGQGRRNIATTVADLVKQQRTNAKPAYEAAYATAPIDDPEILASIAQEPRFRQALKVGARIARTEGDALPADVVRAFEAGGVNGTELQALPVQAIDLMKRGLDDVIERGMKGGKIGRTEARALRNKLRDVLGQVDAMRPEYAKARAQYAGDAAITDAAEMGKDVLNPGKTDELLRAVEGMTDGEREAFRMTAAEAVARMTDGESTVARLLKKNDKLRGLFAAIFPDEGAAERFAVKAGKRQQLSSDWREVLQNSRTAERLAGQDEITGAGAAKALAGGWRGVVSSVADSKLSQAAQGRNAMLAEALLKRLMAGQEGGIAGRDALSAELKRLAAVKAAQAAKPKLGQAAVRGATRRPAQAAVGVVTGRRP